MTGDKKLENDFIEILAECINRGFVLPWLVVVLGMNGACSVYRYTQSGEEPDDLDCEVLTSAVGSRYALPINIMLVDAAGKAARIVVCEDCVTWQ